LLLAELKNIAADQLVVAAVQLINQSRGSIRIGELAAQLHTSQSPLEKRFRKVVGATPKKFASVVRLHAVLNSITDTRSLIEICYEHNFFDQSHFIKDFQQFTGDSPETYRNKL
jgi:methylphosphotriester-DNA--protein-cysteine methyltransferase